MISITSGWHAHGVDTYQAAQQFYWRWILLSCPCSSGFHILDSLPSCSQRIRGLGGIKVQDSTPFARLNMRASLHNIAALYNQIVSC